MLGKALFSTCPDCGIKEDDYYVLPGCVPIYVASCRTRYFVVGRNCVCLRITSLFIAYLR